MSEQINFYGIEEAEPLPDWTVSGEGLYRRPSGWLKRSDYYRQLDRERRAPWVFTGWLCFGVAFVACLVYLFG